MNDGKQFLFPSVLLSYLIFKQNTIMKQRKVLMAIAAVIFIILLLYWLFVSEDINAWLPVN